MEKNILKISLFTTIILFIIVMFFVNPLIDWNNWMWVLQLQLAFGKNEAIEIIKKWGINWIQNFNKLIFIDYIYALSYSIFFSSVLYKLLWKKWTKNIIIYLPFIAWLLDFLENTFELFFINNPKNFSSILFFIHSVLASFKWLILPIVIYFIMKYYFKNRKIV